MLETFRPELSLKEQRLIKKIVKIQKKSLERLKNNEVNGNDKQIWLIEKEVTEEKFDSDMDKTIGMLDGIYDDPPAFFALPEEEMNMMTHILLNFFEDPKWEKTRRGLFRKLSYLERYPYDIAYSLN